MTTWADYSAGRPGGAALRAAGFSGVIRYVGTPGRTKNITAAEYADLVANGLDVLLVFENTTTDVLGGNAAGVNNARAALANARACGIPDSVGIAACADMHLTARQIPAGLAYVDGFRAVLGARTGAYGFVEFVDAVHAAGSASWLWQCGARPVGAALSYVNFWQRNAGQSMVPVSGIACDINDQLNSLGDTMGFDLTTPVAVPLLDANGNYTGDQVDDNGHVVMAPFGDVARFANATGWFNVKQNQALTATVAAMTAALTALASASSSPVTADELKQMINDAVAQHIEITGTVNVSAAQTVTPPEAS
jgi:hypothetical protein